MKKSWMLALLPALLLSAPSGAAGPEPSAELEQARKELEAAREELRRAAQELRRVAREQGHESPRARAFEYLADEDRAMLGVIMGRAPRKDGKVSGVRVEAVTPGGGAEAAGLKAGDVLTAVNGQPLAQTDADDESPRRKLREVMASLKVGEQIKVAYERDGKPGEVTVTATRPQRGPFNLPVPPMPPVPPAPPLAGVGPLWFDQDEEHDVLLPPGLHLRFREHGPWQLVELDEDLAGYFKTREGVLVAKARADAGLGLKSGDVLQKINGEAVKSAREALRQLARAEPGAALELAIVRAGKAQTLKATAPQRERPLRHRPAGPPPPERNT